MADTTRRRVRQQASYAQDVDDEIKNTVAALEDVDHVYGRYRMMLDRWSGPVAQKERLRAQLEALHLEDRQPLVMRLANLNEQMVAANSGETLH